MFPKKLQFKEEILSSLQNLYMLKAILYFMLINSDAPLPTEKPGQGK